MEHHILGSQMQMTTGNQNHFKNVLNHTESSRLIHAEANGVSSSVSFYIWTFMLLKK